MHDYYENVDNYAKSLHIWTNWRLWIFEVYYKLKITYIMKEDWDNKKYVDIKLTIEKN